VLLFQDFGIVFEHILLLLRENSALEIKLTIFSSCSDQPISVSDDVVLLVHYCASARLIFKTPIANSRRLRWNRRYLSRVLLVLFYFEEVFIYYFLYVIIQVSAVLEVNLHVIVVHEFCLTSHAEVFHCKVALLVYMSVVILRNYRWRLIVFNYLCH